MLEPVSNYLFVLSGGAGLDVTPDEFGIVDEEIVFVATCVPASNPNGRIAW